MFVHLKIVNFIDLLDFLSLVLLIVLYALWFYVAEILASLLLLLLLLFAALSLPVGCLLSAVYSLSLDFLLVIQQKLVKVQRGLFLLAVFGGFVALTALQAAVIGSLGRLFLDLFVFVP